MIPIRQCADICHLMSFFLSDSILLVYRKLFKKWSRQKGKENGDDFWAFERLHCLLGIIIWPYSEVHRGVYFSKVVKIGTFLNLVFSVRWRWFVRLKLPKLWIPTQGWAVQLQWQILKTKTSLAVCGGLVLPASCARSLENYSPEVDTSLLLLRFHPFFLVI